MSSTPLILQAGHDVVTYENSRFWAERGLIHWEDVTTGQYGVMSVKSCLERCRGINDMVGNSKTGKGYHRPDEVTRHARWIEKMVELCRIAQRQGEPDNPQARRDLAASRTKRFIVPAMVPSM